jgi:hypothetical protein
VLVSINHLTTRAGAGSEAVYVGMCMQKHDVLFR